MDRMVLQQQLQSNLLPLQQLKTLQPCHKATSKRRRLPQVINWGRSQRGHRTAHHDAGRGSFVTFPAALENTFCPDTCDSCCNFSEMKSSCRPLCFNRYTDNLMFNMGFSPSNCLLSFGSGLHNHFLRHQQVLDHISVVREKL